MEKLLRENKEFLEGFKKYLEEQNLTTRVINNHYGNVELFIEDYLVYYQEESAKNGFRYIDCFLGDWIIEKCAFANTSYIKSSATSIKKFYKYMLEQKLISKNDYDDLVDIIKKNMDKWLDTLNRYDEMLFNDCCEGEWF